MYVCGPTVYGDAHLGHARPYVVFDMIYRYLQHTGYRVRYVRNITDVGHLENDADEGEDKIAKKARLEQLEPMEVAHHYTEVFERDMRRLNILSPSIEPRASGHIIEQVELIQKIMQAGFAYETNGSVYFDVTKYSQSHPYGELSGRVLDDLQAGAGTARRVLEGQDEKRNPADFALWKKASPEHIMRWPSPWSDGFPGWHIECSAMSKKYLGPHFDIHGGGMDLLFPHHECEIAQSVAGNGQEPVKYWIHNNMLTINGQKMGKSLGNFITIDQLLNGTHSMLEQPYSAMTVRFFILQAQYRSTLDFSNAALQAAEKGFNRLMQALVQLDRLKSSDSSSVNIQQWVGECYAAMNDDFNSAILIAKLFEAAGWINQVSAGQASLTEEDLALLKEKFIVFITEVLGLVPEENDGSEKIEGLMELIIDLRKNARTQKDFATSDKIRDQLSALGFAIKDGKEGTHWEYN
jgi:cysteinyl-tRNA synthetase